MIITAIAAFAGQPQQWVVFTGADCRAHRADKAPSSSLGRMGDCMTDSCTVILERKRRQTDSQSWTTRPTLLQVCCPIFKIPQLGAPLPPSNRSFWLSIWLFSRLSYPLPFFGLRFTSLLSLRSGG